MLQKGHLCRYFLSNCQKDFFFFTHSSFQSFATDTAKIVWESPEMTQICPTGQKQLGGRCPRAQRPCWLRAEPGGGRTVPTSPGAAGGAASCSSPPQSCARGRGNISARFIEGAKKGLKSCPAVCICYCDLNVNTLRRDFNFCTLSASLLRPPCILSSSSTVKFTQKRQQFDS